MPFSKLRPAGRYVVPYKSLSPALKQQVDDIKAMRNMRLLGPLVASGAALEPTGAGMAAMGAVGTAFSLRGEKHVIRATRAFGNLIAYKPERVLDPHVVTILKKEGATHAHVDRKGNVVFTSEPKRYGMEIIPHPLKLRWRMKVPLFWR